ncbi:MAG: DJ-1/PfpI family protein [Spirochaetes bacterium]|nr:DJ-1/PfpI family protein [Spirochaetota bacterium]
MNIKVLIAEGFEEIEAITLIDLLQRAGYNLNTVSIMGKNEVEGGHKIRIITDSIFGQVNFDDTDVLILPGGVPGVPNLASDERVLELIKTFYNKNKYIAAICAAPFVLDRSGILKGKKITCYPSWEDKIDSAEIIHTNVVVDGKIITGRGVGAAIEMGLKMVEIFTSKEESEKLREKIVYQI